MRNVAPSILKHILTGVLRTRQELSGLQILVRAGVQDHSFDR